MTGRSRIAAMILNSPPPQLEQCCMSMSNTVIGVPSEDLGEEVKAVVQLLDPADAGPAMEAELLAYCKQHMAAFKCPRSVDFDATLPRHPTGKLYKQLVRQRYWPAQRVGSVIQVGCLRRGMFFA